MGITNKHNGSCTTKPEMIAIAKACCMAEPVPMAKAKGNKAKIAAAAVAA